MIWVKAVLTQDDPGETAGGTIGGVDRQAAPAKIRHGCHIGITEKPEQRTMGVDAEHLPVDAAGQPMQKGPAQTDRRAAPQTLRVPGNPVVDGDMDTLILVIAFLVGNLGDQFLVNTTLDISQIDRLHGQTPYQADDFRSCRYYSRRHRPRVLAPPPSAIKAGAPPPGDHPGESGQ